MAKLAIKSDNITPFGGLHSIFKRFSTSGLHETIDSHLGRRSSEPKAFTYGDVFGSLFGSYLCGGRYAFNACGKMNSLLLKCLKVTGQLNPGDCVDLDFDHQFIAADKKDAKYSYKKSDGYFPGIASVGGLIVGIENRSVNISKGGFTFAPAAFLPQTLLSIERMPEGSFEEIADKYVEMNVAHPFREGNGRTTRIWLDLILKKRLGVCVDLSRIDKYAYLSAMERSVAGSTEIKRLLREALTDRVDDREMFMKGIDYSYYYEESYTIISSSNQ